MCLLFSDSVEWHWNHQRVYCQFSLTNCQCVWVVCVCVVVCLIWNQVVIVTLPVCLSLFSCVYACVFLCACVFVIDASVCLSVTVSVCVCECKSLPVPLSVTVLLSLCVCIQDSVWSRVQRTWQLSSITLRQLTRGLNDVVMTSVVILYTSSLFCQWAEV